MYGNIPICLKRPMKTTKECHDNSSANIFRNQKPPNTKKSANHLKRPSMPEIILDIFNNVTHAYITN